MEITIKIKSESGGDFFLFNSRKNYLKSNYGNTMFNSVESVEFDEEYQEKIGPNDVDYHNYSTFLLDCVKHNFKIVEIDSKSVDLDPYRQDYTIKLSKGINIIKFKIESR